MVVYCSRPALLHTRRVQVLYPVCRPDSARKPYQNPINNINPYLHTFDLAYPINSSVQAGGGGFLLVPCIPYYSPGRGLLLIVQTRCGLDSLASAGLPLGMRPPPRLGPLYTTVSGACCVVVELFVPSSPSLITRLFL